MAERKWVENFVPGSSSAEILDWLLKAKEIDEPIDKDKPKGKLIQFKQETRLVEIDLIQLREFAEFQARIVSFRVDDPRRVARHQIAETALDLAVKQGISL